MGAGIATAVLIAAIPLPAGAAFFAVAATGLMTLEAYRRVGLAKGPRAVREIVLRREAAIEVEYADGGKGEGRLQPGSFVAPWLTVVRWRPAKAWRDRTVLVLPDMLDRERFRGLRVALRWR